MLEWFAKIYEKMCSICAGFNFILLGILGAVIGYNIGARIIYDYEILLAIVFLVIGVIIALFLNVMTFGFIAQITEIRRRLELIYTSSDSIDYMLKGTNFDEEITNIKKSVENIEEIIKK